MYTLYSYWRSSCSWRVRAALHWKGIAFETVPVHLVRDGGQQHSQEHRARNGLGQVPVLMVQGVPLTQSAAIIEYLDDVHPEPRLFPASPEARAKVRQMAEIINSGIQPIQNLAVMQLLKAEFSMEAEDARRFAGTWIQRGFDALEPIAATNAGTYLFGDSVTAADLYLLPQLYNARRFNIDLTPYPTLTRVEKALEVLEAFQWAHPSQQPDAE